MRSGFNNLPSYLPLSEMRAKLGHWLEQTRIHDAWIPIKRHNRIAGALIGPRDLEALDMASKGAATYSEYMRWERRARIEMINEVLEAKAREKMRVEMALRDAQR